MNGPSLRLSRGDFVFRQGEQAATFYQMDTGLVRLLMTTLRGRVVTLRHVLPGDYFGEEALTEQRAHPHGAEALTSARILPLDPQALTAQDLLRVSRNLGDQLRRAMQSEVNLQSGDLRCRVVRYLLELVDTPLGAEDAENRLFVRATHELLAEGSGSTRESVSKIVTDLRDAGLIETGYRHLTLIDLAGLRQIAALTFGAPLPPGPPTGNLS